MAMFVDDIAFACKDPKAVDEFVAAMWKQGFSLDRDGNLTSFLGIGCTKNPDGSITMLQTSLIDKVLETTNMTDCNPNWVPASVEALGKDPDEAPMDETWSYPSVVGMLLYLSSNTRADLGCSVSQVARFNHAPKQSHAMAAKAIVRHLKRT